MILEKVELLFDPKDTVKVGQEITDVFADDLAMVIWLGIRQTHAASQNFNSGCLAVAAAIRMFRKKRDTDC